jgi:hypothetical protein
MVTIVAVDFYGYIFLLGAGNSPSRSPTHLGLHKVAGDSAGDAAYSIRGLCISI